MRPLETDDGFSLLETVVALGVLTVGLLGAVGLLAAGMRTVASAPGDLTATQKAVEAIESVVSARDSRALSWADIRNVEGESGDDGGVFLDGPRSIRFPGDDGLVATEDDGAIETVDLPGRDGMLGTADDETVALDGFSREIVIRDVTATLRSITVIVTYRAGGDLRTYSLTTYVSNYA